jgi:protein-tyrosine-phosphatase
MIRRVLLVCSGNTCRSPMAAALLRHLWEQAKPGWELETLSAGTGAMPGEPATEHAITAMKSRGLELAGHRSRGLSHALLTGVDLVLTMTGRHKDQILMQWPNLAGRVFTLGEYSGTGAGAGADLADPFGGALADYEATAAALEIHLKAVVERIRREGKAHA